MSTNVPGHQPVLRRFAEGGPLLVQATSNLTPEQWRDHPIAGTWSINEYISRKPVVNHSVMMNSLFCLPGYYLVEECSPTSAGTGTTRRIRSPSRGPHARSSTSR